MKSKLRRPFRAPREAVDRSKGGEVVDQLDAAKELPPPDGVQSESEEATELGVLWKPFVVKETEYPEDGCKLSLKMVESLGDEHAYLVRGALRGDGGIDNGKGITTVAASPNLSEFETFLDGLTTAQNNKKTMTKAQKKKKAITKAKNKEDSDESEDLETFGDIHLRALASRPSVKSGRSTVHNFPLRPPEADNHSLTVSVEDIL